MPPEIQESEFSIPSNRPRLNRWDYLNCDQKVAKVSAENPDTLEFGRIKFRIKLCPKLFHTKTFCEYHKFSKWRLGCLFNHWNFRGFFWGEALKRRGVKKKLENLKNNFHVVQAKSNCNWNIFNKCYPLCEVTFIRKRFITFLRENQAFVIESHQEKEDVYWRIYSGHILYDFQMVYDTTSRVPKQSRSKKVK